MKKTAIAMCCLLVVFNACLSDKKSKDESSNDRLKIENSEIALECESHLRKRKDDNLNISILLDLSDRIDLPRQQSKDSSYVLSLAKEFNNHISKKKLGLLYDKIEVFFEPTPINPKINELTDDLKVSYVKGISKTKWMPQTLERYGNLPSQIYEQARNSSKKEGYPGSDTWGFFKNHVKDYCIEECRRNILVILTDGYLYHEANLRRKGNQTSYLTPQLLAQLKLNKPQWHEEIQNRNLGFIPATNGLEDLEVLVIGIQSQNAKNPYAQEIIETYWQTWLAKMNVKKYKTKSADLPSHIEKVIADFISKKA